MGFGMDSENRRDMEWGEREREELGRALGL
jgi:hypothetical protein